MLSLLLEGDGGPLEKTEKDNKSRNRLPLSPPHFSRSRVVLSAKLSTNVLSSRQKQGTKVRGVEARAGEMASTAKVQCFPGEHQGGLPQTIAIRHTPCSLYHDTQLLFI